MIDLIVMRLAEMQRVHPQLRISALTCIIRYAKKPHTE